MATEQETQPSLTDQQLTTITKDELILKWRDLIKFTDDQRLKFKQTLADKQAELDEINTKKSLEIAKLKNIILMKYVSSKEQESTNQFQQSTALKSHQEQTELSFVDPSINSIIIQLKRELDETKKKRDDLQNELNSWKFNPDSQMSKRLMAKCRKLLKENEELGKVISSGNVAQLENDLAYHKEMLNEACENEQNINSFLSEMDNEMEAMQATILDLQEQLRNVEEAESKNKETESTQMATEKEKPQQQDEQMNIS